MKKEKVLTGTALLLAVLFLASACSNSRSFRKCNGRKAIRTPMGPM